MNCTARLQEFSAVQNSATYERVYERLACIRYLYVLETTGQRELTARLSR
jgi:hypothetical protein